MHRQVCFSDFEKAKSGTHTKRLARWLEVKDYSRVHFNIIDDADQVHHLAIKHVAYISNLPFRLLSPQHWSQQAKVNFAYCHGNNMKWFSNNCIMYWSQRTFQKQFHLIKKQTINLFLLHWTQPNLNYLQTNLTNGKTQFEEKLCFTIYQKLHWAHDNMNLLLVFTLKHCHSLPPLSLRRDQSQCHNLQLWRNFQMWKHF